MECFQTLKAIILVLMVQLFVKLLYLNADAADYV